jgi:hypothetical protein
MGTAVGTQRSDTNTLANQYTRGAAIAVVVATDVGLTQKALSEARILSAIPRTYFGAAGGPMSERAKWLLPVQALTMKSTIDVVPYEGGPLGSWRKAYVTANVMKAVTAPLSIYVAASAGIPAVLAGGPGALIDTRQGRSGLISAVGGVIQLGFMGLALKHAGGSGMGRFGAMLEAPELGRYRVAAPALLAWAGVLANQGGLFDELDDGNTKSTHDILQDFGPNLWTFVSDPMAFIKSAK